MISIKEFMKENYQNIEPFDYYKGLWESIDGKEHSIVNEYTLTKYAKLNKVKEVNVNQDPVSQMALMNILNKRTEDDRVGKIEDSMSKMADAMTVLLTALKKEVE